MYGCESWTVKKAERQRIDAFELWCWRRLLRVPWTARRSNQCILKEISPGISLEGMMLKLKLQYFGHLMWRVDSLEKTLMLGGIGGSRRRGRQRMRWLDGMASLTRWMWVWVNSASWWWTGGLACCDSWGRKESDTTKQLNWPELRIDDDDPLNGRILQCRHLVLWFSLLGLWLLIQSLWLWPAHILYFFLIQPSFKISVLCWSVGD